MIVLWHKAGLYDSARSSLSTWLFRIARNRRIDLQRRAKARVLDEDDPTLQPAAEIGADEAVANDDRDAHVRAAVSKLPEEQREMLRAAFFLGQSHSEIAEATGLPLGTVKTRMLAGMRRLKEELGSLAGGGSLGGALDFRNQVLDPARNALGHISVGLADVINDQHHAGIDLNGALGQDFFNIGGVQTLAKTSNTGSATLAVTRTSASALTESDYYLTKTATGWTMRREDTGATVTLSGSGTAADPFVADGISIVVSGTASTNDSYLIRPTRAATAGMSVAVTDPAKIAAAAPIKTIAGTANTGTAAISAGKVVDPTDPNLRSTAQIQFTSATTYTINGAGSYTYTSGSNITVNGVQVQITGTPATGDMFTIQDNTGGTGDNRNAQALYDSLNSKTLSGGTASVNDTTNRLIGNVGVLTQQAQANRDAQKVVQQEAADARDSVSGVNLDEEAANLVKYQQAYAAAAQMIGVANTLFNSLLSAVSR